MNPFFSIIIPLYNKEKHIKDTLDSVWNQTFKDFEVIVVNDGSTDKSLKILNTIHDDRLHIFTTENSGVSKTRNFGISKAKSDKLVFLDADDFWYPHHLDSLRKLHKTFPNSGMYCKAYEKKDGQLTITSKYKGIPKHQNWEGVLDDYFESSLINSIAWTSAVMIPSSTFNAVGTFDPKYNSGEDTDLWIRIALKFPVVFSNDVSAIHNLSSEQKITQQSLESRQHLNFDVYEAQAKNHKSLKVYLDLNRYAMAMQYKLDGQNLKAEEQFQKIDKNHLSSLQRFIYSMPKGILNMLLKTRKGLRKLNIDIRLFRG